MVSLKPENLLRCSSLIMPLLPPSFCAHSHDLVDARNAATASVLTSSLVVPSDRPASPSSGNVLAAEVKGNGEDGNNDNDQGDGGDDPVTTPMQTQAQFKLTQQRHPNPRLRFISPRRAQHLTRLLTSHKPSLPTLLRRTLTHCLRHRLILPSTLILSQLHLWTDPHPLQ